MYVAEVLSDRKYVKDSETLFHLPIGKNIIDEDLNFYVERKADWDTEMGQCVEFRSNNDILLVAYCQDRDDFISVLNLFNVQRVDSTPENTQMQSDTPESV